MALTKPVNNTVLYLQIQLNHLLTHLLSIKIEVLLFEKKPSKKTFGKTHYKKFSTTNYS